jgi:hypothetical protein
LDLIGGQAVAEPDYEAIQSPGQVLVIGRVIGRVHRIRSPLSASDLGLADIVHSDWQRPDVDQRARRLSELGHTPVAVRVL